MLSWPPFYLADYQAQYTFITRAKLFPSFLQIVQVANYGFGIHGLCGVAK